MEILAEDADTDGPSSFTIRTEYLFAFQFWYCNLCAENQRGVREGTKSIVLLIFLIWRCFTCRLVRGCGLGQKLLFRASWNLIFSSRDLSWRNKNDLTGYFYILFLRTIVISDFLPLEILKNFLKTFLV